MAVEDELVLPAAGVRAALGGAAVFLAAFLPAPPLFFAMGLGVGGSAPAEDGVPVDRRGGIRKSDGEGRTRFLAAVGAELESPEPPVVVPREGFGTAVGMGVTCGCGSPLNGAVAGSGRVRLEALPATASSPVVVLDEAGTPDGAVGGAAGWL